MKAHTLRSWLAVKAAESPAHLASAKALEEAGFKAAAGALGFWSRRERCAGSGTVRTVALDLNLHTGVWYAVSFVKPAGRQLVSTTASGGDPISLIRLLAPDSAQQNSVSDQEVPV